MTDLAIGLVNKGLDVIVYAGYPSYWGVQQKSQKNEKFNGVTINRIFHIRSDTRTKFGSILIAVSFFLFTVIKLLVSSEKRLYLFVTTPPFLPFAGYLQKKIRKQPYIIIVHDIHPEIAIKIHYMNAGIISKIWDILNNLVYNNADSIIVLGKCMETKITDKYPQISNRIHVIQNWEDPDFIRPMLKDQNKFSRENNLLEKFVITYSGNMGINHNLEIVIDAAKIINNPDIDFIFFGEGSQKRKLIDLCQASSLSNVRFFDFQPLDNLPYTMTCGDAIIISQEKGTEGLCVSSKFYTALAAGKPVIAIIGEDSEIAETINQFKCGVVISNYNPETLAKSILELQSDMVLCQTLGDNARIAFEHEFTLEIALKKYYTIVNDVI